jgi:ureidoacrylate peracid hydrolase
VHNVAIRQEIIDRVMARRGRVHWFDTLDPKTTALVVIDMQSTFCEPGAPGEVAVSREIVEPINALTRQLRPLGVPVIWVLHANTHNAGKSDADDRKPRARQTNRLERTRAGRNRYHDHQKPL